MFFFKQKTAYEMRISDWSSDVCSSDLEVEECHMIAGRFDYLLKVRTLNIRRYREVLGEKISSLPHVASTSTSVVMRSEERRVGKECVSTCRSRWSPYH